MSETIQIAIQFTLIALLAGISAYFRAMAAASAHLADEIAPDRRGFRLTIEPKWAFWSATAVYGFSTLIILGLFSVHGFFLGAMAIFLFIAVFYAARRLIVPQPTASYWPSMFHAQLFKRTMTAMRANQMAKSGDTRSILKIIDAHQLEIDAMQLLMAYNNRSNLEVKKLIEGQ